MGRGRIVGGTHTPSLFAVGASSEARGPAPGAVWSPSRMDHHIDGDPDADNRDDDTAEPGDRPVSLGWSISYAFRVRDSEHAVELGECARLLVGRDDDPDAS